MFSETKSEKLNKSICIEKYCNKFFRNLPPKKYFKNINNNNSLKNYSVQNNKNIKKINNKNNIEEKFKNIFNINKKIDIIKKKIKELIIELKLKQNDFKNRRCIAISSAVAAAVFYTAILFLLPSLFILNKKKTIITDDLIIKKISFIFIQLLTINFIIIFIIIAKYLFNNHIKRLQKRKEIYNTILTINFFKKLYYYHKISYQIYTAIIMKVNKLKLLPTVIGWRVGISMVKPDPGD